MILAAHTDLGHNSMPNTRHIFGGHVFLSSNEDMPPANESILDTTHIIKAFMSPAAETELGMVFTNVKAVKTYPGRNGTSPTTNSNPNRK